MASKKYLTTRPNLSEVKEQFKIWRRTRKTHRPIPEKLWQAAVSLTATHSVSQISKELVLDYTALNLGFRLPNTRICANLRWVGISSTE